MEHHSNGDQHLKHQDKKHKYVLDENGKPKIGPDGKRIKLKHKVKKEKGLNNVDEIQMKHKIKVKTENNINGTSDLPKKVKNKTSKRKHDDKKIKTESSSPTKAKKVKKEDNDKWKWWEEDEKPKDGRKWTFLEHKGPLFPPAYERLPSNINLKYNGEVVQLSDETEEMMTFYAKMLDHDYTTKDAFNKNFMHDWRQVMNEQERMLIVKLKHCDFKQVADYFKMKTEERKARSKDEKLKEKKKNEDLLEEYGFCKWDKHKEKIGNFRVEPPGLFRGRGNHPKMGKHKKRLRPEDVIINCSKNSKIPKPPPGRKWKEVRHDNKVTWLACWIENIQGGYKYIMLNANSRIKGEKDWMKYETARKLKVRVDKIRADYLRDMKSAEMAARQRAVALYFIDKLALRAGNEKDEETADTVGCCSLRCEHINLHKELDGKEYVVEFDFLGKDSIRYYNKVSVPKQVFKNLNLFQENKNDEDDLFDRLSTAILNKYLNSLMEGLTAKVFRTYNASITLQQQLNDLTDPEDENVVAKVLTYNRANRAVAVLCNHQRAAPKNFTEQMQRVKDKITKKNDDIAAAKQEIKSAKSDYKHTKNEGNRKKYEAKKKKLERLQEQLMKLEVAATDKEENKEIALGTSKLNYLDPRISVAWCKKWSVPLEKVYNKTQRDKFAWAIAMVDETYEF